MLGLKKEASAGRLALVMNLPSMVLFGLILAYPIDRKSVV